tara:strand:- start:10360 stop:12402 length:2043 start_codon:yes stop_codon:yes gene_type:complete
MVNYEIKSQLAKLLATEDLVVENRDVSTASFDVEKRVLTLPMWKRASNTVYDMLVGHEVGHALYTPNEWDWEKRIPRSFVNITEDARIEKLMKRRFPGLCKSFYRGYEELSESDFFELEDTDISEMNLADRINLHYKIGNFSKIPFTEVEQELVDLVGESESFKDALDVAEKIYKFCKDELNNQEPELNDTTEGNQKGEEKKEGEQEDSDSEGEGDSTETDIDPSSSGEEVTQSEPEVTTDEIFNENVSELNGLIGEGRGNEYYEVPKLEYEKIVNPNKDIHDAITIQFKTYPEGTFQYVDSIYNNFKKTAQREVSYLVKEFECKKSADAYARTTTARTGVLDCTKLHTYKYNEDLFRKVSVVPDGKNHGLIFVLDWSGSMADCMESTIKQLYNLVWFCSKVNIPFDVYAFTSSYNIRVRETERDSFHNEFIEGNFTIDSDFSFMNVLTSKVNKKTLETQMKNLFRVAYSFRHYVSYAPPGQVNLSGTPLNESMVALHTIIPKFKKENNLQKVQCVILTDGEAHQLNHFGYSTYNGSMCPRSCVANGFLRNRKTGHTYQLDYEYWKFTDVMLKDLKQTFPDTNFIGIRLISSRDFVPFVKRYQYITEEQSKVARKDKSYRINDSGFDAYFVMIQNSLDSDSTFEVENNATKSKIKSSFMKSLKAKTLNKKVLSQFMDLVC